MIMTIEKTLAEHLMSVTLNLPTEVSSKSVGCDGSYLLLLYTVEDLKSNYSFDDMNGI